MIVYLTVATNDPITVALERLLAAVYRQAIDDETMEIETPKRINMVQLESGPRGFSDSFAISNSASSSVSVHVSPFS